MLLCIVLMSVGLLPYKVKKSHISECNSSYQFNVTLLEPRNRKKWSEQSSPLFQC